MNTENKKKAKIWSSVTQRSMELHFGASLYGRVVSEQKKGPIWLSILEESRFGCEKNRLSSKK